MKKINFIIFILAILVLAGAGCYGASPNLTPDTNAPAANVPATNNITPTNENIIPPSVNVEQPTGETPKTATVVIQDYSFNPPSVTIAAGGEVTWTNSDLVNHTVTGEDWGSELFGKDRSFTKKFETPGVYPYHCAPHPNMTGRVVVK
ncbi:MAG: cupredoxin family copper-binding protein [Patescibacteria group bacterium]